MIVIVKLGFVTNVRLIRVCVVKNLVKRRGAGHYSFAKSVFVTSFEWQLSRFCYADLATLIHWHR